MKNTKKKEPKVIEPIKVQQSYYEILGFDTDINFNEYKKKYIELIKINSPEKNPENFMKIKNAYDKINKPSIKDDSFPFYHKPLLAINQSEEKDVPLETNNDLLKEIFETPFDTFADIQKFLKPEKITKK